MAMMGVWLWAGASAARMALVAVKPSIRHLKVNETEIARAGGMSLDRFHAVSGKHDPMSHYFDGSLGGFLIHGEEDAQRGGAGRA